MREELIKQITDFINNGKYDSVVEKCNNIINTNSKDIDVYYYKIIALFLKKNYDGVIKNINDKIISILQNDDNRLNTINIILGISYFFINDFNNAMRYLQLALDTTNESNKDIVIYYYFGISSFKIKDYEHAVRMLVNCENEIRKYLNLDKYSYITKIPDDKLNIYIDNIIKINIMDYNRIFYYIGCSYFEKSMYKEASDNFFDVEVHHYIDDNTITEDNTRKLFLCYYYLKEYEKALNYFPYEKNNHELNLYKINCLISLKKYDELDSFIDTLYNDISNNYNPEFYKYLIKTLFKSFQYAPETKVLENCNIIYKEIKEKQEKINIVYDNIVGKKLRIDNIELATFFDAEVERLKIDLNGCFNNPVTNNTTINENNNTNATNNKFISSIKKKFSIKLGYTKKFGIMIIIDIVFIVLLLGLNLFHPNFVDLKIIQNIKIGLSSLFISGILFWVTKYYNRRIHETVQLIEDYQHKSLVLKSFNSYSKEIERLSKDNPEFLLDYLRKVSSTINRSPALDLNKRKADNSPVEDMKDILLQLGSLSKLKN